MKTFTRHIAIFILFLFMLTPNLFSQNSNLDNLTNVIRNFSLSPNIERITTKAFSDSALYSTVVNITEPVAPFVYGQYFIFVYYNQEANNRANIAFEHENYSIQHVMKKLENNPSVKVYAIPRTHEVQTINYRLIVNNIWTKDISNPSFFYDNTGIKISTVVVPAANPLFLPPIIKINEKTIRFYLHVDGGTVPIKNTQLNLIDFFEVQFSSIFLVGNFTSWDPYLIVMKPVNKKNTLFYADVPIKEGQYYYYYHIGGTNILDPKNQLLNKRKSSGEYVNSFQILPMVKETTGATTFVVSTK